ncbi:hypothetical protein KM295_14860 [Natronomonas sp. F2-12]|jgi:hypothetical protein|uniref:Uncharacterized protein n=1 Tax=Natronomonas aquatica TaxID=2841590 RepID=A0A9R1D7U9_9EURY|nr:hypothetical protein [Natronomonas aquatica]MCQ4334735.1 hypothetical protein [Natronomonas aquatica]
MCLDKIPVEFDAEGNATLSDDGSETTSDFLDDVTVSDDELDAESRFTAVVEELPERALDSLSEVSDEYRETDETRTEPDNPV